MSSNQIVKHKLVDSHQSNYAQLNRILTTDKTQNLHKNLHCTLYNVRSIRDGVFWALVFRVDICYARGELELEESNACQIRWFQRNRSYMSHFMHVMMNGRTRAIQFWDSLCESHPRECDCKANTWTKTSFFSITINISFFIHILLLGSDKLRKF